MRGRWRQGWKAASASASQYGLVRDPACATGLPERAGLLVGDLNEPATLTPAFDGVDKLFLLTPGIRIDHTALAVAAAEAGGVSHIVHLSSINVLGDPMPAMGRWHHEREEIVRASGIPAAQTQATHVRGLVRAQRGRVPTAFCVTGVVR
nr:NAD(P)H-binding protein [Streptacidiphilus carbonis]